MSNSNTMSKTVNNSVSKSKSMSNGNTMSKTVSNSYSMSKSNTMPNNSRVSNSVCIGSNTIIGNISKITHCSIRSVFFILIYTHILKAIYYKSYKTNIGVYLIGTLIYVLSIATAFVGYVLPY